MVPNKQRHISPVGLAQMDSRAIQLLEALFSLLKHFLELLNSGFKCSFLLSILINLSVLFL
jgi:hypothetical protein